MSVPKWVAEKVLKMACYRVAEMVVQKVDWMGVP
jgi:hypothetical protein